MTPKEKLESICRAKTPLGQELADRLELELREIEAQNEHEYVLSLLEADARYKENPNNLLVYHLLGIAEEFDANKPPAYVEGEFPDIDIDYLGPVRDYLRHKWASDTFGEENVCAIGNYTTFGLKSSFLDMARVHGLDSKEIAVITKKLEMKDEDGKLLTYDKAMEEYPDLREYCEHHPDVRDSVRNIVNRNRGMGTHAGGLIISSKRIDEFVPLVRGKEGAVTSAWSEGLHGQDLGPMGLIKFDLLGITDLMRIALACKLIKERHGLKYICSDEKVNRDWSDTAYLDDPLAIAMANAGDLLGIFQFDSSGIRKLAKGNVTSFDDLVAFSALYRPGPLGMKMHDVYVDRKHGRDKEFLENTQHPILVRILGKTYGVMAYQEQVMQILHAVGDIPLKDCEAVRKAISKKKIEKFGPYKDQFVRNGQINLGWTADQVENLWKQIESFAEYGFNKSHSVAYTYISSRLLWLKAHYPVEFFAATLSCEKTIDKIKEYKRDAMAFGRDIGVVPVDINKSGKDFTIGPDGNIYYGLGDLKGIGEDSAQRIVDGQPYANLQDFLERFGTDAKVCVVLIELGCFGMDRERKMRFYEAFKTYHKKRNERDKRNLESRAKFQTKLLAAIKSAVPVSVFGPWVTDQYKDDDGMEYYDIDLPWGDLDQVEKDIATLSESMTPEKKKEVAKAYKAYTNCIDQHARKVADDETPDLREFELDSIDKSDSDYGAVERAIQLSPAEIEHYGFSWMHPIELSSQHRDGTTFEDMRRSGDDEYYVEVLVRSVIPKLMKKAAASLEKSKKQLVEALAPVVADLESMDPIVIKDEVLKVAGDVPSERQRGVILAMQSYIQTVEDSIKNGYFYSVSVEDANSEINTMNVWQIDWDRFGKLLSLWVDPETGEKTGNILRMQMVPPNGGFPTYGLKSWKRHEYRRMAPHESADFRVAMMEPAQVWKNW